MLYLAYLLYSCNLQIIKTWKDLKISVVQVQVNYQTEKQYIVANMLWQLLDTKSNNHTNK